MGAGYPHIARRLTKFMSEKERIRTVYEARDCQNKRELYAWYRPEVRRQECERGLVLSDMLHKTVGSDLSDVTILDVGCGTGSFLRTMVEWGAEPANLVGTEFLVDRLEMARDMSPSAMRWHIGALDEFDACDFDLVTANTVFSSILDVNVRQELASEMWRVLKPGGWTMVFDFRYDNPSNSAVSKVARKELERLFPAAEYRYKSVILAPPLSRKLSKLGLLSSVLPAVFPFLRSHFIFMAKKHE